MKLETFTLGAGTMMALQHASIAAAGHFTTPNTIRLANGTMETTHMQLTPENAQHWESLDAQVDNQEQARRTNTTIHAMSQSINFNLNDSIDKAKVAALEEAFGDAINMATITWVSLSPGADHHDYSNAPGYLKYFNDDDAF